MGSGFGDRIYWNFFTIKTNYDSAQSMIVYDSLHSLLDYERSHFHCDERRIEAHTLSCLERHLSKESSRSCLHGSLYMLAHIHSLSLARIHVNC
jgi:hypothetical protein